MTEIVNNNSINGMEELINLLLLPDEEFKQLIPFFDEVLERWVEKVSKDEELFNEIFSDGKIPSEDEIDKAISLVEENLKSKLTPIKINFIKNILLSTQAVVLAKKNSDKHIEFSTIKVPITLLDENIKMPEYAREGDAGLDVYSPKDYTIKPGETQLIPLGFKVAIPKGYELQVRPRSGNSLKTKLRIANAPGTIDSGYRGEVGVIAENIDNPIRDINYSFDENGKIVINSILHGSSIEIPKGMKIAQLVLVKVETANFVKMESVDDIGENRGGGFGHTDNDNK